MSLVFLLFSPNTVTKVFLVLVIYCFLIGTAVTIVCLQFFFLCHCPNVKELSSQHIKPTSSFAIGLRNIREDSVCIIVCG